MNLIIQFINENWLNILKGVVISIIVGIIYKFINKIKCKTTRSLNELLNNVNYNDINWCENLDRALNIKKTVQSRFPEYSDYLLIQYGSSVSPDNKLPSDYDYIVLLLGYPSKGNRYIHNKGTLSDESNGTNKDQVDIVFRDYLSFLFAASAGMPYENSVLTNSRLIKGHSGYYQWLKNITKNILMDKEFLMRRFEDKIVIEKQEFQKCINESREFNHDKYYVIRSGYYYITSLLQLKRIKNFKKVVTQEDVVEIAKVRNLYEDIANEDIKNKYIKLVENLKRNFSVEEIDVEDMLDILKFIGEDFD